MRGRTKKPLSTLELGRRRDAGPAAELVREEAPPGGASLPALMVPERPGVDLTSWVQARRARIEERLAQAGALLFRGFGVDSSDALRDLVRALCGEPLEYRERSSPRHEVEDRVYTSTDHPAEEEIFPHNEHSYSRTFPLKLFFGCVTPAQAGGETPIGDTRKVLDRIEPEVRRRFEREGWMYVRNFHPGLGLDWTTVFQTDDRDEVERYCRQAGIECEWRGDRLRTRQVRPVLATHPRTGERVWFNHATFFHVSTLSPSVRSALESDFGPDELPNNTFYGSGDPIEPEVVEHLREAYRAETVALPWQRGDVLLVDNMLAFHARNPFEGDREVLVAMAEPYTRTDL